MHIIKFVQCGPHSISRRRGSLKSMKKKTFMTHSEISNGVSLMFHLLCWSLNYLTLHSKCRGYSGPKEVGIWTLNGEDIKSFIIKLLFLNSPKTREKNHEIYFIFDVCVSVHHIWNWREILTWCNNLFIIINNSTCFGHLYAHLQEY